MGIAYLWDTNVAIYYLQNQFSPKASLFIKSTIKESWPAISAITEIELLCWKTSNEHDISTLKQFIADTWVFELESEIKLKTADIRRKYKIKLPDAIIAATSQVHGLTLLTRNVADFKNIEGLDLIDPYEM